MAASQGQADRRTLVALIAVGAVAAAASLSHQRSVGATAARVPDPPTPTFAAVQAHYAAGLDSLDAELARLDSAVARGGGASDVQRAFRAARSAYKRVEGLAAYYAPSVEREINGPALTRTDEDDPDTPLQPLGFQVIEAELFPASRAGRAEWTRRLVAGMRGEVTALRRRGADTTAGDAYVLDAMRQEIARVTTLGLAGFDATLSGDALSEAADALLGVRDLTAPYRASAAGRDPAAARRLEARLDSAVAYLRAHPDFERLDRLEFIARHATPAAHALADVQRVLGVPSPERPRAWSASAPSIFDRDAFDPRFFTPDDAPPSTPALTALGRALFFDRGLSPAGDRSCATCHLPHRAFTDGRPVAARLPGAPVPHAGRDQRPRNTPTLVNAALQPAMFYDQRARFLEDQIADVLGSRAEMGGSLESAAATLRRRPGYAEHFAAAFGARSDSAISARSVRYALAAYVRSLVALDSRFDRAARGDTGALSGEERLGFNLFMGKARCGTCHFAPLFNGATPPALAEGEPEVIGVPRRAVTRGATVDPDLGRWPVRRIEQHRHAFKTPTLRNVALTAPYMHNGAYATLDQVVDFYDRGGGAGIGAALRNQTLPTDPLRLTKAEKRALLAFMRALTDTSFAAAATPRAP